MILRAGRGSPRIRIRCSYGHAHGPCVSVTQNTEHLPCDATSTAARWGPRTSHAGNWTVPKGKATTRGAHDTRRRVGWGHASFVPTTTIACRAALLPFHPCECDVRCPPPRRHHLSTALDEKLYSSSSGEPRNFLIAMRTSKSLKFSADGARNFFNGNTYLLHVSLKFRTIIITKV